MTGPQIENMQRRIRDRFDPTLKVDGFWGPVSQSTCRRYLRSLMPSPNPWPSPDQASLRAFYGEPGDERNFVRITFPYPMFFDDKRTTSTLVHRRCADSLLRVLTAIRDLLPQHPHIKDEAEDFGGVYNNRNKRGGTTKSLHAWAAAIDLDADDNGFRNSWPMQSDMPMEIIEAFAREGWVSAAAFWGFDPMHFQATK